MWQFRIDRMHMNGFTDQDKKNTKRDRERYGIILPFLTFLLSSADSIVSLPTWTLVRVSLREATKRGEG